jgi:hypothetical protein
MIPRILSGACVVVVACSGPAPVPGSGALPDPQAPARSAALGDTVRIRLGRSASVDRGRLRLTFVSHGPDSRCPANAVCVWMGDVAVRVAARLARLSVERELHTGLEPRSLTIDRYLVTLIGLLPYPGTEVEGGPVTVPTALLTVEPKT